MRNPDYSCNRHSCYNLKYHLVVATKYRHKVISPPIMSEFKNISERLFATWGCEVLEIGGEPDHLHILFSAPPQVQLSKLINNFKTVSSRLIRKQFAEEISKYYWKPYYWNRSYLIISSGGASIEVIKKYIQSQGQKEKA